MRYSEGAYYCSIVIFDEYDDRLEWEISLSVNKIKKQEIIKLSKKSTNKQRLIMLNQIKNWFLKNADHNSKTDVKGFLKLYEDEIKQALRIHNWKNIDQIKEDKQRWVRSVDQYIEYIDSGKQYKEAQRHNDRCGDMIDLYNKVIKQMEDIVKENADVEYSFGLYRFKKDGKYEYVKFNK